MYVALFIIMDVLIFALLLIAVYFLIRKIREKSEREHAPIENDMEEFRNETLHEQAKTERHKLVHIEEVAASRDLRDEQIGEERDE